MDSYGLFEHVVTRFSSSPENVATESLAYVLRSPVARQAFVALIGQAADISFDDQFSFRTQVGGSDASIPDLVGFDSKGNAAIVLEAKFWAGLTDNQPLGYMGRMPQDVPGTLVFLAPASRLELLSDELQRRCRAAVHDFAFSRSSVREARSARLSANHTLLVISWRRVLTFLHQELESAGDNRRAEDVLQLIGLCDRMDSEAYLPLTAEDLTSQVPWRIMQYGQLIDDLVTRLAAAGRVSTAGRRITGGYGWFGRSTDCGSFILFLGFNAEKWAELAATPLWISIYGPNWAMPSAETKARLIPLELLESTHLFEQADHLTVPLFLPTGVEHEAIVDSLEAQVDRVLGYLGQQGASVA